MYWQSRAIVLDQRRRFTSAARVVAICTFLGLLYPAIAREFSDGIAFLNGFILGLTGGLVIAVHQYRISTARNYNRIPIVLNVVIVSVLYTLGFTILIVLVVSVTRGIETGIGALKYFRSDAFREFVAFGDFRVILGWSLFCSLTLSFTFIMSRKMTGGLLHRTILGKYAHPREEHRAFLFIDLNNATTLAEQMGEDVYFKLINDFFADITPALMLSGSEIYRYVGDEVAVSWLMNKRFDPAWCVRAVFLATDMLESREEYYMKEYGVIPSFKVALHDGNVLTGEVGDVKAQIMFHGDAIYITEQIEQSCRKLGVNFLISESLLSQMELPGIYKSRFCDKVQLGKLGKEISVYTIERQSDLFPA